MLNQWRRDNVMSARHARGINREVKP